MKRLWLTSVALTALMAAPAMAADLPVSKAPPTVVTGDGIYAWVDGWWDQINLPRVGLGFRANGPAALAFPDNGVLHNLNQRLNGSGGRAGIGYNVPGTNWRAEFGFSYFHGSGTPSETGAWTVPAISVQLLNGSGQVGFICQGAFTCRTSSGLTSDITSWQLNGKVAYDGRMGVVLLSPSLAIFGGESRSHQSLSQAFSQIAAATSVTVDSATYNADTSVNWTDIGARIGLDGNVDVAPWLTLGAGGYVGVASRRASFVGSDLANSTPATIFNGASDISVSANTTAFVANAEAGAAIKVTPLAAIRGFVGVNYDNRVPGISSPSFTGSVNAPTTRTPAAILFAHETSYYAGGGIFVRLSPGPVYAKN